MKQKNLSTEACYILGILILAFGTALMEAADFGVSMVVAPAYLLHLKLSQVLPFFSFGMAEYTLQAVLLLATALLLRRFKLSYLFSFVTAVLYGLSLDGCMLLVDFRPTALFHERILCYVIGLLLCTAAISLLFHTYISPEAYELFIKEVSARFGIEIHRFKIGYDIISLVLSVLMSFAFFGLWQFEGVKLGTLLVTLVNGILIGMWSHLFERLFRFTDSLPWRKYFD